MKTIIFSTIVATVIIFAVSCGQSSSSLKFKTIEVNEFIEDPESMYGHYGLRYNIRFTYPSEYKDKAILDTLQRKFITCVLGKKYALLTPNEAINACIKDLKKNYLANTIDGPLNHAYFYSDTILLETNRLLQLQTEEYRYMAGAHGTGCYSTYLFNLQTGKGYSRNDIFKSEANENIRNLIRDELYQYWEEDLNYDIDAVWTEETNFAVTSQGIMILYNDYELGYYALGRPKITIPYDKIFPYLRQDTPVWDLAKEKSKTSKNLAKPKQELSE
jgi:hypothetical protein